MVGLGYFWSQATPKIEGTADSTFTFDSPGIIKGTARITFDVKIAGLTNEFCRNKFIANGWRRPPLTIVPPSLL